MNDTSKGYLGRVAALEPVLTRGALVSTVGVIGTVLNLHINSGTTETVVGIVFGAFALVSAFVTRSAVVPKIKVVSYLPSPYVQPDLVVQPVKDVL